MVFFYGKTKKNLLRSHPTATVLSRLILSPPLGGNWCAESFSSHFLILLEVFFISTKDTTQINDDIRAKEVRVIGDDGEQIGILPLSQAKEIAYDKGLDLVLISPQADPPVCRVMDYGKFRFERDKKEKEARKKQQIVKVKEVKLSCRIDTHDFETKANHAKRFLADGNKVRVCLKFRGREMAHQSVAYEIMERFAAMVAESGSVDKKPNLEGRQMTMFIAPLKQNTK